MVWTWYTLLICRDMPSAPLLSFRSFEMDVRIHWTTYTHWLRYFGQIFDSVNMFQEIGSHLTNLLFQSHPSSSAVLHIHFFFVQMCRFPEFQWICEQTMRSNSQFRKSVLYNFIIRIRLLIFRRDNCVYDIMSEWDVFVWFVFYASMRVFVQRTEESKTRTTSVWHSNYLQVGTYHIHKTEDRRQTQREPNLTMRWWPSHNWSSRSLFCCERAHTTHTHNGPWNTYSPERDLNGSPCQDKNKHSLLFAQRLWYGWLFSPLVSK